MKHLVLILLMPTLAFANATSARRCYSIPNLTQMNLCLALETNQQIYCGFQREKDDKSICRAQVTHQNAYCFGIKSDDTRRECFKLASAK